MKFNPKGSPGMKKIIEALAVKHKVDLTQSEAHFCLDLPGYDRLVVENLGSAQIYVGHDFKINDDLVENPALVFFTGMEDKWIPINITRFPSGFDQYIIVDDAEILYSLKDQKDLDNLVLLSEEWAKTIEEQGWLEEGTLRFSSY